MFTEENMNEVDYAIEGLAKDLVLLLMEDFGMDMKSALRTLYTSDTYAKLQDAKTGLYFQSPRYVYDFLRNEVKSYILLWIRPANSLQRELAGRIHY